MAVTLYRTSTEYLSNAVTMSRGTPADIVSCGVYHTTDAAYVPTVSDFTTVTLVQPGNPLADGDNVDVLSLIGPKTGAQLVLAAGTYQRFVLIQTASEAIIRKVDVISVL